MEHYSKQQIIELLQTDVRSQAFYDLIAEANRLSRAEYQGRGYIFAQIGLNAAPCSGGCRFCSLGCENFSVETSFEMSEQELRDSLQRQSWEKVEAFFLMTTADYNPQKFLNMCRIAKEILPRRITLVANVGDFDLAYAKQLVQVGVGAVYHIVRLREEVDTKIPLSQRLATLDAARQAGLEIYYCIEPIGREHTYEEIATEILRALDFNVSVMAMMSRVPVAGTAFADIPEISSAEIAKIAAVVRLVVHPKKSMNVHEPKAAAMLAGVNQLYAEMGVNPRDTHLETADCRGYSIERAEQLLGDFGYTVMTDQREGE